MKNAWATLAVMAMVAGTPAEAWAEGEVTGIWIMDNGKVTVSVAPCDGGLCGTVVALKKPRDDKGRPRLDKENPNKSLRSRPVIGLTILSNMKPSGSNKWRGTIYNPDDGYTYRSKMKLQNASTMKVEGCFMVFCKTMKFKRLK